MKLDQSVAAIVTGGASGLGEATARALAARGVKVAIFDMAKARGTAVAKEIGGTFCHADVTDIDSIDAAFEAARKANGQERICVNCAGIAAGQKTVSRNRDTGAMIPHDSALFANVININLIGSFNVGARSAAGMATSTPITDDGGRGVLIFTASVAAQDGQVGQAAYAASKAGIAGLVLPVARDLTREGIRAMAIMPGLFHTPMFDSLSDEVRQSLAATVPFPTRLGDPAEYAGLALHICENEMLNGTAIRLDGALRMAPR